MSMLPSPDQLSGVSVNVGRFDYHLQKQFAQQGLRNKTTQVIRLRPTTYGSLSEWMHMLCEDKEERQYIIECVNEHIRESGWRIVHTRQIKSRPSDRRYQAMDVTLKYRAARNMDLDVEIHAA